MSIIKLAALNKARKKLKSTAGDLLNTLGSHFLSDFEGEFELKNGRFVVVKSVGTPDNPSLNFSIRRKSAGERAKEIIIKSIAITIAISLFSLAIRKILSKKRR
ncbi:MAG: hypothetical protein LBM59_02540 [Ruminococcus sp.]|jgi:hypothetical protein|nr:hypothetical protein [Ruminococcus sp.]